MTAADPRCGTTAGYQAHRRRSEDACRSCRTAQSDWMRHYRARMYLSRGPLTVDSTGTRRRIQALMRMGWSLGYMGQQLGVTGSAVGHWCDSPRVRRVTARKVADLYDRLWDKRGPSTKTAGRARIAGWPPPLAWDDDTIDDPKARSVTGWTLRESVVDEVAVQRAMHGERVRLRPVERAEAVLKLTAQGLSAAEIGTRLRMDKRSVQRIRDEHRKGEAA